MSEKTKSKIEVAGLIIAVVSLIVSLVAFFTANSLSERSLPLSYDYKERESLGVNADEHVTGEELMAATWFHADVELNLYPEVKLVK